MGSQYVPVSYSNACGLYSRSILQKRFRNLRVVFLTTAVPLAEIDIMTGEPYVPVHDGKVSSWSC